MATEVVRQNTSNQRLTTNNPLPMALWRKIVCVVVLTLGVGVCGAQHRQNTQYKQNTQYRQTTQYKLSSPYYGLVGMNDDMLRRSVEMGVNIGASYMGLSASSEAVSLKPKMGVRAALQMSLQWDEAYALQMEVGYLHNKIDAKRAKRASEIKSSIVEVPVMFSYRGFRPVRLGAGVVLTPIASGRYDTEYERLEAGQMRSMVGYVANVGVSLTQHLLLDARFTGSFAPVSNYFEGAEFTTRGWWLSVGLGYMF